MGEVEMSDSSLAEKGGNDVLYLVTIYRIYITITLNVYLEALKRYYLIHYKINPEVLKWN